MKLSWWKLIVGFIFYLFFHQIYDIFPGSIVGAILGERISGVYPHMKMLFYAYLFVSLIDYFLRRNTVDVKSFLYARMLTLSAVPWMMIATYYSLEAVGIPLPGRTELIWGIFMTLVGLYFCIRLEEPFEGMSLGNAARTMIVLAFAGTFITYIGFSFHVPDNFFEVIESAHGW